MPFKKPKKKVYEHKKPKPKIDWTDEKDLYVLDMSKPEKDWEFVKVTEK